MMDSSPTMPAIPEKTEADRIIFKRQEPQKLTPSGYAPGWVKASDGTVYEVQANGQFRRVEKKMTKAELKRYKRERRQQRRKKCVTA